MADKITVTKTFLPPLEEYTKRIEQIWESRHITNHGPFTLELEAKLKEYFGVEYLSFVNNGTIALQIAIKAADLKGEIITTPFSYVATTSSIVWEGCKPVFVDIDPDSFCINPDLIEAAITEKTTGIIATHVYGNACAVEKIDAIAKKHNLRVIYDAAHAFGVKIGGRSLMNFGDISTLSFHATKLFHTGEGGAIVTNDKDLAHRIAYMRNFGHNGEEAFWGLGINAKGSELHSAMGVAIFPYLSEIISARKEASDLYEELLADLPIKRPATRPDQEYNYAYFPVLLPSEESLLKVKDALNNENIFPRRYFYPALSTLSYVDKYDVPVCDDIAPRIMCLPLYHDLEAENVRKICDIIRANI